VAQLLQRTAQPATGVVLEDGIEQNYAHRQPLSSGSVVIRGRNRRGIIVLVASRMGHASAMVTLDVYGQA
jgi:hypothetical protein